MSSIRSPFGNALRAAAVEPGMRRAASAARSLRCTSAGAGPTIRAGRRPVRVVQLVADGAEQLGLAQDAVARHAAIAVVEDARPLRPRLEIGRDRGARIGRGHRLVERAVLVQRLLAAAQHLPELVAEGSLELAPEDAGRAVEIGFQDEDRVVVGGGEHAHRHEVQGGDVARARGRSSPGSRTSRCPPGDAVLRRGPRAGCSSPASPRAERKASFASCASAPYLARGSTLVGLIWPVHQTVGGICGGGEISGRLG